MATAQRITTTLSRAADEQISLLGRLADGADRSRARAPPLDLPGPPSRASAWIRDRSAPGVYDCS